MELPFEKTVCRYWKQKLYGLHQTESTQELRIPDGMPDAGRVIGAWGQEVLRGKDWRDREVGINGGVMVWVLYQPEDGSDPQRLETWIPFQIRADMPPSDRDGAIRAQCAVRSVDARITSTRKLMVRCTVGLLIQTMVPEEAQISLPGELPEDLEVLRNSYPLTLTVETGEKSFLVDEEPELPGGLGPIDRIVYFQFEPQLQEQRVFGNRAVFRGMGALHLLYWSTEGRLCCADIQVPFSQYMDLEGEYGDQATIANLFCVTSAEADVTAEGRVHLRCGLISQYTVQDRSVLDLVEDAYSPCRDVELAFETLTLPAILDSRQETVELSAAFQDAGDAVYDHCFRRGLPAVNRSGEDVKVTLDGEFGLLSPDREGRLQLHSAKAASAAEQKTSGDTVAFGWRMGSANCRREGSDWRVDTKMVLDLSAISREPMTVVSGITVGDTRAPDPERPSVIIRRRGEEDRLWDLAKRCGSTVSAIRRMNKLESEPESDRLLLIPVI